MTDTRPTLETSSLGVRPYFESDGIVIIHGDCLEVLPALGLLLAPDVVITDPPYGETTLPWDRWPIGWVDAVSGTGARSLWCFGSLRMLMERSSEISEAGWRLAQDVIWSKNAGSGFAADRFKRTHELVSQFYRGRWAEVYKDPVKVLGPVDPKSSKNVPRRLQGPPHTGAIGAIATGDYVDTGVRLMRSIIEAPQVRGGLHPTQKPAGILSPLIRYSCPPGGLVLDPMFGSGATLEVARALGRRAVGVEVNERYCEAAARVLGQQVLL